MKRFILGFVLAISIPVMAAVLWPSGAYLETFQNGFIFGTGKVLSVLNNVITFDDKRLDDAPKDRVYFQDFEGASVSFICDANLTKADDTSTPLNESRSVTFTQGATPPAANAKCAGPTISLPLKAQTKNLVEVCFQSTYTGNDSDIAVNIESGGSNLVQVAVLSSTTAKKHCGYFSTSSTTSVDLDIEVLTPNADEILEIDDVEITVDPLAPTNISDYISSVRAEGNGGTSITAGVTDIDFVEVSDSNGAWDGNSYTVQKNDSIVQIDGTILANTSYTGTLTLYKNGSSYKNISENITIDQRKFSYLSSRGEFVATDSLSIRSSANITLSNSAAFHHLNISEYATSQGVVVKGKVSSDVTNSPLYSANIAADGSVSGENVDWIDGNCTGSDPRVCDLTFTASAALNCVSNVEVTTTTVSFSVTGNTDASFIVCTRSSDYVPESDRTIVLPEGFESEVTEKLLTSDVTATGDISDLQFDNLIVGKWYQITGQIEVTTNTGVGTIEFFSESGGAGTQYGAWEFQNSGAPTEGGIWAVSLKFKADSTSLYTRCTSIVGSQFYGNNTKSESFLQLTELNTTR